LRRVDMLGRDRKPLADRLVSIVFANPSSPIWDDLAVNRAFLDGRSGTQWDLFFAGISAFAPMDSESESVAISRHPRDFGPVFNPGIFSEVERRVVVGHANALKSAGSSATPWRYRGGTDVTSFMVYGPEPDWLSLKYVPLYTAQGDQLTLVHVTEGLRNWQEEEVDPLLAPGESPFRVSPSAALLTAALGFSASAVTAGVLGNAAYDLLKTLFR
jgi:hypothetical protein